MFTMEDATQYLAQVKEVQDEHVENITKRIMLGKGTYENDSESRNDRIKKMKADSVCKSCGKPGHWYKDYPECLEKMRSKLRMRRKRFDDVEQAYMTEDEPKQKVTSFFRQRGK